MEKARQRFAAAVTGPAPDVRLDVAAFCIAAHAHPGLDIDGACAQLDELAAQCPTPTFDGLRSFLFDAAGFTGNMHDYGDPENSFLDSVVSRRQGIPISLSVLMMEVGRRIGVDVRGVGMPGHFLVQDASERDGWCDPFHGGVLYDADDCQRIFQRLHGAGRAFHPAYLSPTQPRDIVARMLANLENGRLASDPLQLAWMCDLHLELPELPVSERARLQAAVRSVRARWN